MSSPPSALPTPTPAPTPTPTPAPTPARRVLVIEDEPDLALTLAYNLKKAGYEAWAEGTGAGGVARALEVSPDLVLLDIMLPDTTGFEVCKALKADPRTAQAPVLMLTARGEELDRVQGFEVGAEDYVLKPFSVRELLLRIKVILRRAAQVEPPPSDEVVFGPLRLNLASHQAWVEGEEVPLTVLELKLLSTLIARRGKTQSRAALLADVWGYEAEVTSELTTRTVDTHIKRLREKIGVAGELVETIRGVGYRCRRLPDEL